jgi:hypothetical protein
MPRKPQASNQAQNMLVRMTKLTNRLNLYEHLRESLKIWSNKPLRNIGNHR